MCVIRVVFSTAAVGRSDRGGEGWGIGIIEYGVGGGGLCCVVWVIVESYC